MSGWVFLLLFKATDVSEVKIHEIGFYRDESRCRKDAIRMAEESLNGNEKLLNQGYHINESMWGKCIKTERIK